MTHRIIEMQLALIPASPRNDQDYIWVKHDRIVLLHRVLHQQDLQNIKLQTGIKL